MRSLPAVQQLGWHWSRPFRLEARALSSEKSAMVGFDVHPYHVGGFHIAFPLVIKNFLRERTGSLRLHSASRTRELYMHHPRPIGVRVQKRPFSHNSILKAKMTRTRFSRCSMEPSREWEVVFRPFSPRGVRLRRRSDWRGFHRP